eukprot:TRINITY_DN125197_c0_g1_i1.p3 TRINITY_DN125197_c0_g1~~TRINITY_DN125197_c0_g1_i1.p3  ORF type:complete len:103 (-),score=16.12 TRINITY_DN125197_c0_g1_i1:70-378(-)
MSGLRRLKPLANRVLVRRIEAESKTAGGVLLPDSGAKKNEGVVVAVGPGWQNKEGQLVPCSVKEGDTVLLPEYGGHTVKLGEEEMQLFRDEDILAVLEDERA